MPELPEVQTVVNGLRPVLEGGQVASVLLRRPNLRFEIPKNLPDILTHDPVTKIFRRAKYVCFDVGDFIITLHLGMSGQVLIFEPGKWQSEFAKHDHVIFNLENGHQIRYRDPRRFGYIKVFPKTNFEIDLLMGPEPLEDSFTGEVLHKALAGKKQPIKQALLDQRVVAGLGNIYVCEALYQVGLHPETPAKDVTLEKCHELCPAIKQVLNAAIESGGSSLKDHVQTNGELGYFQHNFKAYGREGQKCLGCEDKIMKIIQSGRSTFFCPTCQKRVVS